MYDSPTSQRLYRWYGGSSSSGVTLSACSAAAPAAVPFAYTALASSAGMHPPAGSSEMIALAASGRRTALAPSSSLTNVMMSSTLV